MELGTNHLQTLSTETKEAEEGSNSNVPLASSTPPPTLPTPTESKEADEVFDTSVPLAPTTSPPTLQTPTESKEAEAEEGSDTNAPLASTTPPSTLPTPTESKGAEEVSSTNVLLASTTPPPILPTPILKPIVSTAEPGAGSPVSSNSIHIGTPPPTLPTPTLKPSVSTAEPEAGSPVTSNPIHINTAKKKPSIERYLGKSPECFVPAKYAKPSNSSPTHRLGTKIGVWSESKSRLRSFGRWTTDILLAVLGKLRTWSSTVFNTWPFNINAWARLNTQSAKLLSNTTEDAAAVAPSDVIKSIPMPLFPIRVFYGKPPPFSLEKQKRVMRWRYSWRFRLYPELIQQPDTQLIRETVKQYIDFIAPDAETISVDLLAQGVYNQAYNIAAENKATGFLREYIFRVALPIYPYYKVESDVATTEYVRHSTDIPVPIIYAFDSSPDNKLGFEWMLMEKIKGVCLYFAWDTMEFDAKEELTKAVAKGMDQLSRQKFNKIGSLYCRQRADRMEFSMGPSLHNRLYEGDRLLRDVFRGPFDSLRAFYDAVLDSTERHLNDPRHRVRHEFDAVLRDQGLPLSEDDSSDDSEQEVQKSEEEIQAHAKDKDRRNERQYGVTDQDLYWIPDELANYRNLLPKLCPLPSTSEPMLTVLTHPDLSRPNIFVDDSGVLVAIIDWERACIEPTALLNAMPRFLVDEWESDPDCLYVHPRSMIGTGRRENKLVIYDDEVLTQIREHSEGDYTWAMCRIQETHLRAIYRKELKRLESPICKAFERDTESLEQQLISRVFFPEKTAPFSAIEWAAEQLGEPIPIESDEESASEDKEEPAERGELHGVDEVVDPATASSVDS